MHVQMDEFVMRCAHNRARSIAGKCGFDELEKTCSNLAHSLFFLIKNMSLYGIFLSCMEKDFDAWNKKKKHIDCYNKYPFFRVREVWWCVLGINIGVEANGKNYYFERPVLILKRINSQSAFVLPISSNGSDPKSHVAMMIKGKLSFTKLSQARTVSAQRFLRKIETVSGDLFEQVLTDFIKYLSG